MLVKSVEELVGKTPLLELTKMEKEFGLCARLYAKLEFFNPAGSAKDRIALQMILDAEDSGLLKPGATIIEPTSGNTGIGLAAIGTARGYKVVIVMPDSMSAERIKMIKAYGAEIVLTPGADGMAGAVAKAEQIKQETPGSVVAGQFTNPSNWKAHYNTTGPEIFEDLAGKVDILVAGIGTGGTITGTAKYLKEKTKVRVIGIEPDTSPLITKGYAGAHGLQGIGANFIPDVLDQNVIDEVLTESLDNALESVKAIGKLEGVFIGISGGAALHAAIEQGRKEENRGKNIVVVLPDGGDRYLSNFD